MFLLNVPYEKKMRQNPLMIYNHITSTSKPILHQLQNGLAAKLYYRMSMMKTPLARISLLLLFSSLPVRALDFSGSRSFIEALSASSGYKERAISFYSLAVPAGGRAETLGSAYTGISDDVSLLDANPAASSVLVQNEIGVFHNTWIAGTAMETLAAAGRKSDFGFGGALRFFYVPFDEYDMSGERIARSLYSETTALFNVSYNIRAGYYFKGIAIGANVKGAWRSMPDASGSVISAASFSRSALALASDAGIMLRFNCGKFFASREPNLRIGVNLLNAGGAITGFGEKIEFDDPLPTSTSFGLSYRPIKRLLAAAEFKQPLNFSDIGEYVPPSAGCALEIDATDFFSLLAGCRFDGGENGMRLQFGGVAVGVGFTLFQRVRLNVNYTFDRFTSFHPVNHISAGVKILLGDGGRAKRQSEVEGLYGKGLKLFADGDFTGAVAVWNKALAIDRSFSPAKKGIKSAQKQLALRERIRNSQFIGN